MNCVAMNGQNEKNTGYWVAQNCAMGGFPLCERARKGYKQPPLPTLAPESIPCPAGWVGVGPNCYQVGNASSLEAQDINRIHSCCYRQVYKVTFKNYFERVVFSS